MKHILKAPISFQPLFKSVIWGGNKICLMKDMHQDKDNIGESWEISQLPGYESIVSEGKYKGLSISELIERYGKEFLGEDVVAKYGNKFPLLVKFIDANDNLSVQVHPNDNLARKRHNGLGKTEMWYVLSAAKGSKIYAGLKDKLTPTDYNKRVKENSLLDVIETYDSKENDVYFLPPGTIHAIGGGNLVTEIQQSSDITYRIFDYNRKDKDGKPRELHEQLAKDAINYSTDDKCFIGYTDKENQEIELIKCEHFTTRKLKIKGEKILYNNNKSFLIIICIGGNVNIICEEGSKVLSKGFTVLIPAYTENITLIGEGSLLLTTIS